VHVRPEWRRARHEQPQPRVPLAPLQQQRARKVHLRVRVQIIGRAWGKSSQFGKPTIVDKSLHSILVAWTLTCATLSWWLALAPGMEPRTLPRPPLLLLPRPPSRPRPEPPATSPPPPSLAAASSSDASLSAAATAARVGRSVRPRPASCSQGRAHPGVEKNAVGLSGVHVGGGALFPLVGKDFPPWVRFSPPWVRFSPPWVR
jgi:hypothetical protein